MARAATCVKAFLRNGQSERVIVLSPPSAIDAQTYEPARSPTTARLIRDVTPAGSVRI
jgi:hypothetical protein